MPTAGAVKVQLAAEAELLQGPSSEHTAPDRLPRLPDMLAWTLSPTDTHCAVL
jgi:hypothetical protein